MSTCDSAKTAWSPPSLGAPCFMSIPADDVPRAKSFYEKVFDWTFKPSPDPTSYPEATFAMFYTPSPVLMGAIVKSGENSANTPGVGINIYLLVPRLWNREGSVRTRMLDSSQLSCDGFPRPSVCSVILSGSWAFSTLSQNIVLVLLNILLRLVFLSWFLHKPNGNIIWFEVYSVWKGCKRCYVLNITDYCTNPINSSHLVTCDRGDKILVSSHCWGRCDHPKNSLKC